MLPGNKTKQRYLNRKCCVCTRPFNDLTFHELCKWIGPDGGTGVDEETGKQFTMVTLHARLKGYLPDGYKQYTRQHMKRRLQEHFQGNITIADLDGKTSIITLADRATEILHESYVEAEGSAAFDKIVRELGSVIHQDILCIGQPTNVYPTQSRSETAVLKKRFLVNAAGGKSESSNGEIAITALCWIVHSSNHKTTHLIGCPVIFWASVCTTFHSHGLSVFCCTRSIRTFLLG